jgi:hypothetical protein
MVRGKLALARRAVASLLVLCPRISPKAGSKPVMQGDFAPVSVDLRRNMKARGVARAVSPAGIPPQKRG